MPHLGTSWSRGLLEGMRDQGLRDLVLCPGSRSMPIAVAAFSLAGLRCHSAIDERSASFFALGLAMATRRPTAVVVTSGSAGAHALPAILEAKHQGISLMLVTADRPPELHYSGSSQTVDQLKMFSDQVVAFFELGLPTEAALDRGVSRAIGKKACFTSLFPTAGPVHVNVRIPKPLEPKDLEGYGPYPVSGDAQPILLPEIRAAEGAIEGVCLALASAKRPAIVCGWMHPTSDDALAMARDLAHLAKNLSIPVFAEATSQVRFHSTHALGAFDWYLGTPEVCKTLAPDWVLQLGGVPVSSTLNGWIQGVERTVFCESHWADENEDRAHAVIGDPADSVHRLVQMLQRGSSVPSPARQAFFLSLRDADKKASNLVDAWLADAPEFGEAEVTRWLVDEASFETLMVGNSLPIRHLDQFVSPKEGGPWVVSRRGTAGIDGLLATACGYAMHSERPMALLIGDVSFLHDAGSLALVAEQSPALFVVVLNNRGGRIFERLPAAALGLSDRVWSTLTTPHDFSVAEVSRGYGVLHAQATDRASLAAALEQFYRSKKPMVVEARTESSATTVRFRQLSDRFNEGDKRQ
jgi:2-succinyl-5-enolpyruvyl-6-hydroxy-3-cyclohexene-1-carboxylate synthase